MPKMYQGDPQREATEGWIGVDFDGTLAEYHGWRGPTTLGAPIRPMVVRVRAWLDAGLDVRIFTARVIHGQTAILAIEDWCKQHLGRVLPVTNVKDAGCLEYWDDRAVQVEGNTGRLIGRSTRGLDLASDYPWGHI